MANEKISYTKRMRTKNRLLKGKTHKDLATNAMDAVTEFIHESEPDRIDPTTIVHTIFHLEQLLRWNQKQGNITQAQLMQIEDDIMLTEYNKKDEDI